LARPDTGIGILNVDSVILILHKCSACDLSAAPPDHLARAERNPQGKLNREGIGEVDLMPQSDPVQSQVIEEANTSWIPVWVFACPLQRDNETRSGLTEHC